MEKMQKPKNNQIALYSILWSLLYATCMIAIKKFAPSKALGVTVAFIPAITFVLFIKRFIKNANLMDEVERRVQLEAAVWAFSLGLLLLMTLGLLDLVVTLKKEYWGNISFIIPCFFVFYAIGIIISRRKYNHL